MFHTVTVRNTPNRAARILGQGPARTPLRTRKRTPNRRLTELRVDAGLSPNDLGALLGISGNSIREAEKGANTHPRHKLQIADYFGLRPTDIWPIDGKRAVGDRV